MIRSPYPLPAKRKRVKSGIARAPKRVWLRHRKHVRAHCCVVPGCQALDIQCCHISRPNNKGMGLKPHDKDTFPGCDNHHAEQHQVGQGTFEDRYGLDLDAIAAELVRTSPDVKMKLSLLGSSLESPAAAPEPVERRFRLVNAGLTHTIPIRRFVT